MIAIFVRIGLLTLGFAAVEIGLPPALAMGSFVDWALTTLGLGLIVGGSAGMIGPLLAGAVPKGETPHA